MLGFIRLIIWLKIFTKKNDFISFKNFQNHFVINKITKRYTKLKRIRVTATPRRRL